MADSDLIQRLSALTRLDRDAVSAYSRAIEAVTDASVEEALTAFRGDHERHVEMLSAKIMELGGAPPEAGHLVGALSEGLTLLMGLGGTKGVLDAMVTNELVTNRAYADAVRLDAPADVRALLESNYADERRHLAYVEKAVKEV